MHSNRDSKGYKKYMWEGKYSSEWRKVFRPFILHLQDIFAIKTKCLDSFPFILQFSFLFRYTSWSCFEYNTRDYSHTARLHIILWNVKRIQRESGGRKKLSELWACGFRMDMIKHQLIDINVFFSLERLFPWFPIIAVPLLGDLDL